MECGGKRSATPPWLVFVSYPSQDQPLKPKRRRASLATQGKRLSRFLSGIGDWCKENLHEAMGEQHRSLSAKLRGHYQYYGVRGNYKMLEVAYEHTRIMWKKWLGRRNSKNRMNWEKFAAKVEQLFALPLPRIVHAF